MAQSWIQNYIAYTRTVTSPLILRTWSAVWAVGALLERTVWIDTAAAPLYPNIFALFVCPPGIGKGQAIGPARHILQKSGRVNLAPLSMSNKGMLDYMKDTGKKVFTHEGKKIEYTTLSIASPEMGVFLPKNDSSMISILSELYDCEEIFDERLRSQNKTLRFVRPHLHLLSATQPKYLQNLLSEDMFEQGITARMIMIYSSEVIKNELFSSSSRSAEAEARLIMDARKIAAYSGPIEVTPEAMAAIEDVHKNCSDGPEHSKLQHYNTRRTIHTLKVAMSFAASAMREKLTLTLDDWKAARSLMLATENYMEEIFKEMGTGGQKGEIEEAFHFILRMYGQRKKPIPESLLISFLSARVPTYQIQNLIEVMLKGRIIKNSSSFNLPGERLLIPLTLQET